MKGECIFCPKICTAVLWFPASVEPVSFLPGLISLPHAAHQPLISSLLKPMCRVSLSLEPRRVWSWGVLCSGHHMGWPSPESTHLLLWGWALRTTHLAFLLFSFLMQMPIYFLQVKLCYLFASLFPSKASHEDTLLENDCGLGREILWLSDKLGELRSIFILDSILKSSIF